MAAFEDKVDGRYAVCAKCAASVPVTSERLPAWTLIRQLPRTPRDVVSMDSRTFDRLFCEVCSPMVLVAVDAMLDAKAPNFDAVSQERFVSLMTVYTRHREQLMKAFRNLAAYIKSRRSVPNGIIEQVEQARWLVGEFETAWRNSNLPVLTAGFRINSIVAGQWRSIHGPDVLVWPDEVRVKKKDGSSP